MKQYFECPEWFQWLMKKGGEGHDAEPESHRDEDKQEGFHENTCV
jgi:hypothetical protein